MGMHLVLLMSNSEQSQIFFMVKMTVQKYSFYTTLIQFLLKITIPFHFSLFLLPLHPIKKVYSLAIILGLNMQTFLPALRGLC